ncbi:MAG TPA: hypothetical protein VLI54_06680 [Bacillota bacterium]|nr:hypothetical protein [Bacillota bacterium]
MAVPKGTFIILEGVDGSGKATQFHLLEKRLREAGYDVVTLDFPRYDEPSSYFVRQYLGGAYGGITAVGPYTSSLFYALDRFEAAPKIRQALEQGKIVLSNRYTGSSMAHQGTKFRTPEERRGYFIWLDNLEFEMLKLPRPDLSFVLRVPLDIAQHFMEQSGKARDIHESDPKHLEQALAVYDDMTQLFPKDYQRIDCVRGDRPMEIEAVQSLLWEKISPLLPPPPQLEMPMPAAQAVAAPSATVAEPSTPPAALPEYYIPGAFDDDLKRQYKLHIEAILRLQADMRKQLSLYLAEQGHGDIEASALLAPLTPMAVHAAADEAFREQLERQSSPTLTTLTQEHLPAHHAAAVELVQLADVWPRNEFDLVAAMLYSDSNLPLSELRTQTGAWPYTRKLEVIEAYLSSGPKDALQCARYTWDVLSDYTQLQAFASHLVRKPSHQALTPRYGYDMPDVIDDAGLTDKFQLAFDASLELYSLLQRAGFMQESQYATLAGHRLRWSVTTSAADIASIGLPSEKDAAAELVQRMHEKLAEVHPILAETMQLPQQG